MRVRNAADGRRVMACPVDLRRQVVSTPASLASTRLRLRFPRLALVSAATSSAMQENSILRGL
ncbi:hypothetical protein BE11_20485 [Sorangium cellulosum]|nr:hypothetical protein BE11_20485 [Sorangium cellulosum]